MFNKEHQDEIQEALKNVKNAAVSKKLQVLELRVKGYKNKEIAKISNYSENHVSALVSKYANEGISHFMQENRKSGNRRNMTLEEEEMLLAEYKERLEAGQVVEVSEVRNAYENAVGHRIGGQQIYRVLKRHEWRRIMPRSKHPKKADEEAIQASKKLNHAWKIKEQVFQKSKFD
jgi:transposase